MSDRRFALVDFTYRGKKGRVRLHEAGYTYALPRAVAHAATKRELVAKQRPPHWTRPSIFRPPEALSEVEVIEAEAELKALQRHALEWSIPRYRPSVMAAAPRSDARQPSATGLEPASAAVPSAANHQKDDYNDEKRGRIHM